MFVVMTVAAEVFPIRSIRGIMVMVPIFMMHGEQTAMLLVKLPATFGTHQPVHLQGAFAVLVGRGAGAFEFPYSFLKRFLPGDLFRL